MATRFCANCGAKLLKDANFCVECGERQPGAKAPRLRLSLPLQRYAPVLVVLCVVLTGGGAVVLGVFNPKTQPIVPARNAPSAPSADTPPGNLPAGHPPVAIPEQVKQAIRDMAKQAEAAPDNVDTWKKLAEVQYRAGQLDPSYLPDAKVAYQHVLDREPENLDALQNLGNIAFDQEQHDAAIDYYHRYLKVKPDDLSVQTDLGTMYLAAQRTADAVRQFEAVLTSNPTFFQAQFNLAIAYRTLGQVDRAIAALEKARGMAPNDKTRAEVDQMLARAKGPPEPAGSAPEGAPAAAKDAAGAGTFQADAEAIFRQNPILGPKVRRIEWPEAESAKVYVRDFPMEQMPPEMRSMFTDRMKGRIKEKKDAHKITRTARFDLIDDATGAVMDTITE